MSTFLLLFTSDLMEFMHLIDLLKSLKAIFSETINECTLHPS